MLDHPWLPYLHFSGAQSFYGSRPQEQLSVCFLLRILVVMEAVFPSMSNMGYYDVLS